MPTVFKIDSESQRPRPVHCEIAGYPHRDAEGETMYENSHWQSEEDAWRWLLRDLEAGLSLAARDVRQCEARLNAARAEASRAACELVEAKDAFDQWNSAQAGSADIPR